MSRRRTEYELSPGAENDLYEIALYTIQTWGVEQPIDTNPR
ncbi:MAG: type II toxin-antitoxin system RelE/ParE family toxin [Planctomycetes bacterium]|nr:type II toxin-antitoxin system RelE/ParE family toxin [Planctomycetota bacterium]